MTDKNEPKNEPIPGHTLGTKYDLPHPDAPRKPKAPAQPSLGDARAKPGDRNDKTPPSLGDPTAGKRQAS
jgi:hypothetical protein